MKRLYRLKDSEAFQRVYCAGQSWTTPLLILRASPNDLPHSRVGFSTNKRIGKAVARNRVKRLMREQMRRRMPLLQVGWDVVLIAREASHDASYAQIGQALDRLLEQSGLLVRQPKESSQ